MFSHIMVGVSDFQRAMAFYTPVLQALGVQFRFLEEDRPWAGWQSSPDPRPLFLIGRPHNQAPHHPGNGQMVAFLATSRQQVQDVHALALAHGGTCDGPPGLRPEYPRWPLQIPPPVATPNSPRQDGRIMTARG
jgi:catechol 2,3-dioxygenase-like lactoylglutathione lyase family enzyme